MNRFAALLDRLMYEPRRNAKLRLLADYFHRAPDPDRGFALAAMTDALAFKEAKPNVIRGLVEERVDPALFRMSYHYVGDLAETVALIWPSSPPPCGEGSGVGVGAGEGETVARIPSPLRGGGWPREAGSGEGAPGEASSSDGEADPRMTAHSSAPAPLSRPPLTRGPPSPAEGGGKADGIGHNRPVPSITDVVEGLALTGKSDLPARIAAWLDALDETGRWALLKLITGELRVGVSARLAKTAVAQIGGVEADEVELIWHGLAPPYASLFAWLEGRGPRPESGNPAPFRPPMLSHPLEEEDFGRLDAADFQAEWKWDGIRLQAASGRDADGRLMRRLYSRTGEDVSKAFPDLVEALDFEGALDGELLILREGRVQSFNVLQQRLNRKTVTPKLLAAFPAHLRVYDILAEDGEDLRALPFSERRRRLEALVARLGSPRIDLSPLVPFAAWEDLAAARADPAAAGPDAEAIEGVMLKRSDSPYLPGRPKGYWYKWKREPYRVDAVMMYGQRGHGKRSSFYSDYTFGVWREGPDGDELVPVGKAYHGFTDEELVKLDRYVRNHTVARFGPVREVECGKAKGLVLEVAFEGLQRSTRHKSGVAMRFPRISRIRWDKPPAEADRLETLERILRRGEREIYPLEESGG